MQNLKPITKIIWSISIAIYLPLAMIAMLFSVFMFNIAETIATRLFVISILLLLPLPFVIWLQIYKLNHRYFIFFAFLPPLSVLLLIACYLITPKGKTSNDAAMQSIFLAGSDYQRSSIANLVPEIDQIKFGSYLAPAFDPFIDKKQSIHLRTLFLKTYREMATSKEFSSVGSVLNIAYKDILTNNRKTKHFYLFIPPTARNKRVPLFIFLHGSGGNFKAYMWKWRNFAIANNVIVVAPSFGFGNWDKKGSTQLIQEVINTCDRSQSFNISKRILIGLSNGGNGVYKIGIDLQNQFDGLVLISPVMESKKHTHKELIAAWKSKPILVIHGKYDRRIPLAYIKNKTHQLKLDGLNIQTNIFENEDHLLFLSSWTSTKNTIEKWLKKIKY